MLRVENGAEISAKTFSPQKGGNINVNATRRIQLVGVNSKNSQDTSGLFTLTSSGQTGNAGNIVLYSPEIIVKDGAEIKTDTSGAGNGGNIDINAQIIKLIGLSEDNKFISKLSAQTMSGTGNAGNLTINTNLLSIRDGAQINTSTRGKDSEYDHQGVEPPKSVDVKRQGFTEFKLDNFSYRDNQKQRMKQHDARRFFGAR